MAKTTEQFDVYTCDGCGRKSLVPEGEMADGIHGTVSETGSWGGSAPKFWFACRLAHVAIAVKNTLRQGTREEVR